MSIQITFEFFDGKAVQKMNDNQKVKLTNSRGRDLAFRNFNNAGEWVLTESGSYKLIFKSRAPKS